jgi:signal peptidase II
MSEAPRFNRRRLAVLLGVAAAVLTLDQWSKRWAQHALSDGSVQHVIWTLQFNLTHNSGMAFSTGVGAGRFIGVAAIIIVVAVIMTAARHASPTVVVAAGLVLGGALGNLADRAFRGNGFLDGAVIDFIDFQWFPIFNVADIGVDVGAAIFVIWSLVTGRRPRVTEGNNA